VCDQWGPFMEALGASERVIGYLDLPPAPQVAQGLTLPDWSGRVSPKSCRTEAVLDFACSAECPGSCTR